MSIRMKSETRYAPVWTNRITGQSFQAALEHEGMMLTLGDRRSLVVVDHAGGVHAFGKRLLGVNKAQMLERLSGLDINELPTVQQAQSLMRRNQSRASAGAAAQAGETAEALGPRPR